MKNMGSADKAIRIVVAIALIALAAMGQVGGALAIVFYIVGGVFILTSLISFCPLYTALGIKTCKIDAK